MAKHLVAVLLFVGALGPSVALAAPAARTLQTIEQAFETTSSAVSLPERAGFSVTLPGCTKTCPASVQLDRGSRYYVGTREVTLAQLRQRLASGRIDLAIFYDPKTRVVTRIIAN